MKRHIVQVARMRMADIGVGDIINRNPDDVRGWFQVAEVSLLHNGSMALADEGSQQTATGKGYDIVGVQIAKSIEVPDADPWIQPDFNAVPEAKGDDTTTSEDDAAEAAAGVEGAGSTAEEEGEGGGWALGADTNEAETEAKKRRSSVFN